LEKPNVNVVILAEYSFDDGYTLIDIEKYNNYRYPLFA